MSFEGDLEHLPIVDIVQLLHSTAKSGTLSLKSPKGESQLVFHEGYIVSANHVDNSVRIGQVLLDMGLISREELESALHEQQKAGLQRKPIIQTMIEGGRVHPDGAYQGLEVLIEMTIVEILTWTKGTFSLDVNRIFVSDEYRYFPEQLKKQIQLNTQNVLMDALRIYDERKRDGKLNGESLFGAPPVLPPSASPDSHDLSAADLGLDELEHLERKIPEAFAGLSETEPDTPAKRVRRLLAGVPPEEQQRLTGYLEGLGERPPAGPDGTAVILFTADRLLREWVAAVCGARFLCSTSDASGLDAILDQTLAKGRRPLLLVDAGEPGSRSGSEERVLPLLQQRRERYPALSVALFACPGDFRLSAHALMAGASLVLPRSSCEERPEQFITDTLDCAQALDRYLTDLPSTAGPSLSAGFSQQFRALSEKREPSEVTHLLLQAVGAVFQRAVTLVVVRSELIAERGIGMGGAAEPVQVKLRVPVAEDSLLKRALDGESYYGDADPLLRSTVFETLGRPVSSKVLLLPVKSFGRGIALIYADFGSRTGGEPQTELLELLALHAGLVIDNALYRKRCAQKA